MDTSVSGGTPRARSARRSDMHKPDLLRLALDLRNRLPTAGEPSRDYFLSAFKQLEDDKSSAHRESKLECLDSIFRYFYGAQDTASSLLVGRTMEQLAARHGKRAWIRKSKTYRAISLADAGDLQGALLEYRSALRLARELGDQVAEATVLLNIGAALFYAGLYSDAMNSYEYVCLLAASHSELSQIASAACSNMAQVCVRQERYEAGLRYIAKSLVLPYDTTQAHYNLHRVILERVHVELALALGDRKLADERLTVCLDYARRAETRRTAFEATLARGICEIDHGDSGRGLEMLVEALQNATLKHELILCLSALIKAHEQTGDVEQALKYADQLCAASAELYQAVIDGFVPGAASPAASIRRDQLDSSILKRARLQALASERHARQARIELIDRLSLAAELRDGPARLHGHRVGRLCALFAKALQLSETATKEIEVAGRLHDIGKIGVPDGTLRRGDTEATSAEREVLRAHTSIGANLLSGSSIAELRCAEVVARHHHEQWDGQGYPDGLSGKRIPVECRIVSIADCFDAMTHGGRRVDPVSAQVALEQIRHGKGKKFDPRLVDAFCGFVDQLLVSHPSLEEHLETGGRHTELVNTLGSLRELIGEPPGRDS